VTRDFAPRGIGRVIDDAVSAYRASFRSIAVPAAMLLLPTGLFIGLAQNSYFRAVTMAARSTSTDPFAVFGQVGLSYSVWAALAALQSLVSLYYFACLLAAAPQLLAGERIAPRAFLAGGAARFLMMFATSIVVGLIYFIGSLFLLVPGVIAYVYLSMTLPAVALEGAGLDTAMGRSLKLVSGSFWRTIGFFVATAVIVFSLQSALTSVTSLQLLLQQASGATSGSPLPQLGWQVFGGLAQGVAQMVTVPLIYLAWLFYYFDLRARRDGMDLLARAATLAAA
jgi:hypothetical protein